MDAGWQDWWSDWRIEPQAYLGSGQCLKNSPKMFHFVHVMNTRLRICLFSNFGSWVKGWDKESWRVKLYLDWNRDNSSLLTKWYRVMVFENNLLDFIRTAYIIIRNHQSNHITSAILQLLHHLTPKTFFISTFQFIQIWISNVISYTPNDY